MTMATGRINNQHMWNNTKQWNHFLRVAKEWYTVAIL